MDAFESAAKEYDDARTNVGVRSEYYRAEVLV